MQWTPQLTKLRDILAELYPTVSESQQVIQEARHSVLRFTFDSKAITNWHNILNEAIKHDGMVDELATVALRQFDRNQALADAYAAYRQFNGGEVPVPAHQPLGKPVPQLTKVLFLAANPIDTPFVKLDEEVRAIDQALVQSQFRDYFAFEKQFAVRYSDLQQHLLRYQPDIVHFSGHGSETGELLLQGEDGMAHPIREETLGRLFGVLKENIRCVVLNACYSENQATAIAEHIDVVIGMKNKLGDDAARNFAAAFYRGLGFGRTVQTAFDLGCLQIDLANLEQGDEPQLKVLQGDAAAMVFVNK